jgi:DNA-binding IclR family transcriptional regulator
MAEPRITNSAVVVIRVLKALKGRTLHGASNTELAKSLGESPSTITRALQTLEAEGLANKLDNGWWAPGMALLQIAQAHAEEMARAQARINEINQRVMSGAQR